MIKSVCTQIFWPTEKIATSKTATMTGSDFFQTSQPQYPSGPTHQHGLCQNMRLTLKLGIISCILLTNSDITFLKY